MGTKETSRRDAYTSTAKQNLHYTNFKAEGKEASSVI
jgi:hypothetical protein